MIPAFDTEDAIVEIVPENVVANNLVKWLQNISNDYLHYGDFDFAGISIYFNEFEKKLGRRARLFVPDNVDILIKRFGKRSLYNSQLHQAPDISTVNDTVIVELVLHLHSLKKGLEQEILIRPDIS